MFFHFLKKIAFLGCHNISDYRLLRSVFLINTTNTLANIASFSLIAIYILFGKFNYVLTCIPVIFILSIPYILNYHQKFKESKFIFMLFINMSILFGAVILGHRVGMTLFYFTVIAINYIVYTSKELRPLIFFTLLSVLLLLAVELFKETYFKGIIDFSDTQTKSLRFFMIILNVIGLAISCYSMHAIIDKLQHLLLQEEEGKLEQTKLTALGIMSAGIAHEINNPLAIISSRIEQIVYFLEHKHIERSRFIELLMNIQKNADRIARIVKSLRNLARSSIKDSFDPFPIAEIIGDSLELCKEKLIRYNIHLQYTNCDESLQINCRPSEIMQVLINLLNNAVDAIADQEEKWIRISVENDSDIVKIRVIDSGKGIPKELQAKIMQPFFTTKEVGKGTGLGLSISNTIIANHAGRFYIDSSGANTCFVITFVQAEK